MGSYSGFQIRRCIAIMDIQVGGLEFMAEPTKAYPGGELNPSPTKPGRFSGVGEKMNDFKKRKSEAVGKFAELTIDMEETAYKAFTGIRAIDHSIFQKHLEDRASMTREQAKKQRKI